MALCPRNILSLCAGVGGLELGIQLAHQYLGFPTPRTVCHVEREVAAAASLVASMEAGWFHPAPVWPDMLTFDARPWRGLVHILASGDPCQDNSVAGKRAGASGKRFLAPEVVRIAGECRPDLIFRENVPGNLGEQLDALVPPLEGLGYRVAAGIFSSAETGNTHTRERGFVLAQRISDGHGRCDRPGEDRSAPRAAQSARHQRERLRNVAGRSGAALALADAGGKRLQGRELGGASGGQHGGAASRSAAELCGAHLPPAIIPGPADDRGWLNVLDRWPEYQPALSKEEAESHLRRGIDAMAHRTERLRATGNGVDPVVAAYAFLALGARLAEGRGCAGAEEFAVRAAA